LGARAFACKPAAVKPAILFHADGYALDGPQLMGRQSAGNGFLRAAVRGHAGQPIHALTPFRPQADAFRDLVLRMDPQAQPRWVPASRLDMVAELGGLFRPDVGIAAHARERLRIGPARYSVCGLTHTLSSHSPADLIAELATAPVMPWDALICTSAAARTVVEGLLQAQDELLAWRFGQRLAAPRPQLPVIPLGVHCEDFAAGADDRARARSALRLAQDEVCALFAGRLSFSAKVHPFQTYAALERVALATGRKLAVILAGQFPAPAIEAAYRSAAAKWAPSVRTIFVRGADARAYAGAWRAADLFVSLSDNIQETFGITPLEAMAAGLPVLVSDWDGYKDTVRDGVDGFRVPTWAPPPGCGGHMALDYETGANNHDAFLSRTSTTTSVDPRRLDERLTALVENADLRRRQGEAGRERARREFDWTVVYGRYQALWDELGEIRLRSANDPRLNLAQAPRCAPARPDPFAAFGCYPTHQLTPATRVRAAPGAHAATYEAMTAQPMFTHWREASDVIARTLEAAGEGLAIADLAARLEQPVRLVVERLSRLAKMELVMLEPAGGAGQETKG
jgi:glycosyltransferase involved in cell wall biosynthesis